MVEITALIIALLCLAGDSPTAGAFFVVIGVAGAAWRAYSAGEAAKRGETEIASLRSDLRYVTSLAERAVSIAAETANSLPARQGSSVAEPSAHVETPAEQPVPKPAREIPPPISTPATHKPSAPPTPSPEIPEEIPQVVPEWAADTRTVPPLAPKVIEPPLPPKAVPPTPAPTITKPHATPVPVSTGAPAPPPVPAFATTAPRKSMGERVHSTLALEEMLGTNWLNKLGVIILVLGVALFGIYELGQLGPAGKVGLSLAVSAALLGGGIYLEQKERYRVLGRTLIGGGWALLFFTSYALNHVDAMRVVASEVLDSGLMLAVASAMVAHTLRYRSQLVTGLAFLLAYSTVALSHDTVYSLTAGAILAAAVISIVIKMSWFELEVFAILSSYGNHFYWLYRLLGDKGAEGHPFPQFVASTSLLLFYWVGFRFSYVVRKVAAQENISTVAGLLNTLLLLTVMKFQSARPELAFYALLILGAIEFAIGQLPVTKRRRSAFVLLTLIGTSLMIAAIPFRYSGHNVSILWLMGAEVLLFVGILTGERLFRRIGLVTGFIVLAHELIVDLPRMIDTRQVSPDARFVTGGILLFAMAVVFYANHAILRLRWPQLFVEQIDDALLTATSYPAAITLGIACWASFVQDWMAVAFAASMLAVAAIGFSLRSRHLQFQFLALGMAAAGRIIEFNAHWGMTQHVTLRIVSLATAAALFYGTAKLALHRDDSEQRIFRGIFAVIGTALVALLLFLEVSTAWQPVAYALFALTLVEFATLGRYLVLRWHAHAMAAASIGLAAAFDVAATLVWHGLHTGIWKLIPVVAINYLLALRTGNVHSENREWLRNAYTWAGTALALWLMHESLEAKYVAAAWILYAVVLCGVSRWTRWMSLAWQAFVIGSLSAIQCGIINLLDSTPGNHEAVRLSVSLIVIAGLYAIAEGLRLPEEWHKQRFEFLQSWLATALAALLIWYELSPVGIAVAWALLGAVLYEYGALRKVAQLQWQAYLVLCASFVRIFFANLSAGAPGEILSTRLLTVLPIAAIYYFIYSREAESAKTASIGRFHPGQIFAYLGSGAVMALLYFQIEGEWVVTAWAAMIVALLAIAFFLRRSVFAQQCVLLAIAVLGRGMFHNLFGGSYFSESDWRGRFFVLSTAILILFASLPLAFGSRRRLAADPAARGIRKMIAVVTQHVEQPLFFVAATLLTTMLALKMDHGMVTLAWGVEAVLIFIGALLAKERSFRLTGVSLLMLCVVKIIAIDAWRLAPRDRYLTFIVLGASLLLVSFLYSKYSETIRQYL